MKLQLLSEMKTLIQIWTSYLNFVLNYAKLEIFVLQRIVPLVKYSEKINSMRRKNTDMIYVNDTVRN